MTTRQDKLDTLNILVSDTKDQRWLKAQKVHFLNQAMTDVISSEAIPYVRTTEIQLRDEEYEYTFPEDMLEPIAMMFQNIEGAVILSSSWKSLAINYGVQGGLASNDSNVFWQNQSNSSGHATLRDIVSDNKFIFTPSFKADQQQYTVTRSATLPDAASELDFWVDTYLGEKLIYKCNTTYDAAAEQVSVTLSSDYLSSTTDLLFTYDTVGIKYVKVVIVDGGASGTAALATSGDADDRSDPFTYTYTLYDNNSSNDTIIALTPSGMTVTGSNATDGAVIDTSIELDNLAESKWTAQVIHLRYAAVLASLSNDDDIIPLEIPVLIRQGDCLPYIAASKLLMSVKSDERLLIMGRDYMKQARDIIERSREHRAGNGPPYDVEPS